MVGMSECDRVSQDVRINGPWACAILGTVPVQGHDSGILDIPNVCATRRLPNDIFERDKMPNADGPTACLNGNFDI